MRNVKSIAEWSSSQKSKKGSYVRGLGGEAAITLCHHMFKTNTVINSLKTGTGGKI